ncbi:hypothetical protein HPB50_016193 [Hyalomma asiaticum]|uniref:Uncharacterized protein n=1 Tax=Hyalomma asiaticum TaxID=266040 RepID=A0ACB7RUV5_HYAAI|nr:hypothetical protein HPB50_016193 [Hyalomma asiaticum]
MSSDKTAERNAAETPLTKQKEKIIGMLIITALLLLLFGFLLTAYFYSDDTKRKKVATCITDDCIAFGQELSVAINKSADPCHDFHAYVCGEWDDPDRQVSTQDRMRAATLNMQLREIREDTSLVGKAAQFFESCNRAATDLKENLRQFAEFRKSLGLTWPEHSAKEKKHPLDIMVDLALNWQMNFLFDMTVIVVRGSPTLLVLRGRLDIAWEQDMDNPRTLDNYDIYLSNYYEILGANRSQDRVKTVDLIQIEQDIVEAKIEFLYDVPQQDWFSVSTLDSKTPTVPAGMWLSLLAKHDKQFNWTDDSTVIVEDVRILANTEKLMKRYTREDLTIGLSWMFIQTHLWAVCGTPSLRFRGSYSELKTMKERGCMTYVESLLGLSGIPKLMTDRYGPLERRLHAFSFLQRMNENIKRLVNGLPWMDEENKRMAFNKLEKMKRIVMPADSFFVKKQREALYSVFPDMRGKTFMTNLLAASEVYQQLRNHEHFEDVYSFRTFPRFGRAFYLYLPNAMTLAIGDLNPPLFYHNATLAIKYGALGSIAAQRS